MLHGQTRYHARSRFLAELPDAALKWLTPKEGGFGGGFSGGLGGGFGRSSSFGGGYGGGSSGFARSAAPAPAPLPPRRDPDPSGQGLRKGLRVFHTKFGEGVVLALEGSGADARAQVSFGRHGTKWLALSVAKLTPIDD
jgi:DNA helicase-2/ATP-dependent DNA helicase PcrA